MNMKEIKDIAMWEETDSELAKYNIQQLLKTYDDLEEQYKSLEKILEINKEFGDNLEDRINKAVDYIGSNEKEYGSLEENEKIILDILRGKE